MLSCVDVHYYEDYAMAACLLFTAWSDEHSTDEVIKHINHPQPYIPGKFYLRELPCIISVLDEVQETVDLIVIDGYVWLDKAGKPGLGAYLYHELGERKLVIGVAKSKFLEAEHAQKVLRGKNRRPLYITSAGIDPGVAACCIQQMHGKFRIPTLLKKVDQLSCGTA